MPSPKNLTNVEVLGPQKRRRWSPQEKLAMVQQSYEPGYSVSLVARQHGVNANQLFLWRKLHQQGELMPVAAGESTVPAAQLADAMRQIRELQRLLGKKTMEAEILKEAVEWGRGKKLSCALALAAGGHPMKRVCDVLGVARSAAVKRRLRSSDWTDGRQRRQNDDLGLVEQLRSAIENLPSYGYRRAWALLRRERACQGLPAVNHKRVYRVMRTHGLLLQRRAPAVRAQRRHHGRVSVEASNQRWCSDGFEFRCDNGEAVRTTFALDCCDREAMSWVASTEGYTGDDVRDVMLAAVERRFGNALPDRPIQWLSDNGSAYTAALTRSFARDVGLEPVNTPVSSPQSNGMAESFVRTMKRDYVNFMSKPDARTAIGNLAIAFEHYNEHHPHSALRYHSPREFRRKGMATR
ncbi:IS3 family transposase [Comamonas thiooxydans]|uniref:IS3 family transposase n=2 Tax=Comamonas thiooxydans TaxID=363952 RepID=UPI00209C5555|nr:IS3 family transposase [Comamonas thiooxydans]MCO8252171.1 IS3 family transposase [Comamonas thiooxydans]